MKQWRVARKIVQVALLALFLAPLFGAKFISGTMASSTAFGLVLSDPLAALQVLVGTRGLTGSLAVSALIVLAAYVVLRRAFCAWACPVNTLLEPVESLRVRLKASWTKAPWAKASWGRDRDLQAPNLKYWILGGILVLSYLLALPAYEMVSPASIFLRNLLFGFGPEIGVLAAIVALDLVVARRFWCRSLCPLGAFYSLSGKLSPLTPRITADCTGCARCQEACPMGEWILEEAVSRRGGPVRSGECSLCGECIDQCPRGTIGITAGPVPSDSPVTGTSTDSAERRTKGIGRRQFLKLAGGATVGAAAYSILEAGKANAGAGLIRPPGALPEPGFLAACIRCGKCVQACPYKALGLADGGEGLSLGTPYIPVPRQFPCRLCKAQHCIKACPTGALAPLGDIVDARMGLAVRDEKRCLAYRGQYCIVCYGACPLTRVAMIVDKQLRPIVVKDKCTGCGVCEYACVLDPAAIVVKKRTEVEHA